MSTSTAEDRWGAGANAEAIEAWDGPLFDTFVRFRGIVTIGLGEHGEEALRVAPPRPGQRVLDIGCGFGDTTQRIAGLVGPTGEAVGVDAAARFIEAARDEAERAGVSNTRFLVADVQLTPFDERFDFAFSRFGTMFFANPVAALFERTQCARARGEARDGRVASSHRQRLALSGADDRRADREPSRGVRRADMRSRSVLDG